MKVLYFSLLTLICNAALAQPEFAPLGCEWEYEVLYSQWSPPFNKFYGLYKLIYYKDSLINNLNYKKLIQSTVKNIGFETDKTVWIRQEDEKIYFRKDTDYLLYDFGAKKNDMFQSHGIDDVSGKIITINIKVDSLKYETILGQNYKIQYVSYICSSGNYGYNVLHQKYGFMIYDDLFYNIDVCTIDHLFSVKLKCYHEPNFENNFDLIPCDSIRPDIIKDRSIESYQTKVISYPSIVENKLHIQSNSESIYSVEIFNSHGILVSSNKYHTPIQNTELNMEKLKPGFYFIKIIETQGKFTLKKIIKQ